MVLKSRSVRVTDTAKNDLERIKIHLAAFDEEYAARTVDELVRRFFEIGNKGLTGATRSFLPEGIFALPFKRYCFYFMVEGERLILLRVLGQKQDVADIAFAPEDL